MKKITILPDTTIKKAMKTLNSTAEKCLLVVDDTNRFLGTLSDGDIRRSILKGSKFSKKIVHCFNSNPVTLKKGEYTKEFAMKLLIKNKLTVIPVLDDKMYVVDYLTISNFVKNVDKSNALRDVPVVIMAGGRGTRLEPFTQILPKPLVPINGKPIIIHIIENFTNQGCKDFYLTVNYKAKIMKAYFYESDLNYNIKFIDEIKPLGTAGSLKKLSEKLKSPFFVKNCDIIIKEDYSKIYDFHINGNYDITLVASAKEYVIPYGTCEINKKGSLRKINEKPTFEFLINTGLYILNNNLLDLIPQNKIYHITELITDAQKLNKKVGVFPINEDSWIDIGQWAEYREAINKLS